MKKPTYMLKKYSACSFVLMVFKFCNGFKIIGLRFVFQNKTNMLYSLWKTWSIIWCSKH